MSRFLPIAKRAASHIRLWGGKYYPSVIVVDLEDRQVAANDFVLELENALRDEGVVDQLIIGVADRMLENWILSDPDSIGWNECPMSVEGVHGAAVLRSVLGYYDKASDGPRFLAKCRPSVCGSGVLPFTVFMKNVGRSGVRGCASKFAEAAKLGSE